MSDAVPDIEETLVRLEAVSKSYDGRTNAVDNLTLDIRKGEFLTLLGPSGSGKTTTLMMLAGFETPNAGDILTAYGSITATPPHKRNYGVVFQNYALFPHLSIVDNVAFPLSVRHVSAAEARRKAESALELVRLTGYSSRKPHELSGGQQQRAAVARAVVFDPDMVLMDEPFGALDKSLREQMQIEIKHIHRRLGNTMVSVTHDQGEALTMSDRIAVFHEGCLQQIGTPQDIYARPANAFVASFIGDSNRAAARVEDSDDRTCKLRLSDGSVVFGTSRRRLAPGTSVSFAVRPERLRVDASPVDGENQFEAVVTDCVYTGERIIAYIALAGQTGWTVKLDALQNAGIAAGERISVAFKPEHCWVFEA